MCCAVLCCVVAAVVGVNRLCLSTINRHVLGRSMLDRA